MVNGSAVGMWPIKGPKMQRQLQTVEKQACILLYWVSTRENIIQELLGKEKILLTEFQSLDPTMPAVLITPTFDGYRACKSFYWLKPDGVVHMQPKELN